jgi:2-succinyl-5-enolpyruvyl-6-hydroxy-3-cyclohexene-1-carboxylate synthase
MFGLGYAAPQSMPDFNTAYASALKSGRSSIIETTTDRRANKRIHDALYDAVRAALDKP